MPRPAPAATRRWQATLIVSVFVVAVVGAALAGWWYARESSPHQGPIILISVDTLSPDAVTATDDAPTSSLRALAADAVVFERAYTHSPLTLPAHASLLAGLLPFEHGVRDEAGFALAESTQSLAELLRSRGFETGAAVSSLALRPESGIAQGFSSYDAELPETPPGVRPIVERDSEQTIDAALKWVRSRRGFRYFLFVQIDSDGAEAAVAQVVAELKARGLYDQATIVLTADHGPVNAGASLDETSLRVPLLVKQPDSEGAERRPAETVQHIDVLPTVLDLVRAPIPSGLRGRSLRALLDGDEAPLPRPLFYAESLAGRFRLGTPGAVALASPTLRLVRDGRESIAPLTSGDPASAPTEEIEERERLRTELDRILDGRPPVTPTPLGEADAERFAALGYLAGAPAPIEPTTLPPEDERAVVTAHRAAAVLVAERRYSQAVEALRGILRTQPQLAAVHYQVGALLVRAGRFAEAEQAFLASSAADPDSSQIQIALADTFEREGRNAEATARAALAVALAEHEDNRARAAAHQVAALVALARGDRESAETFAKAAELDDPALPMMSFVTGRAAFAEGEYAEALASFESAVATLTRGGRTLEGVYWYLGETLLRLDRDVDAEQAFRDELRAFPRSILAYTSLAMLYDATDRREAVQETLDALLVAVPTPEGHEAAARAWVTVGDPKRAAVLRTDARARFRGDPSLVIFQRRR